MTGSPTAANQSLPTNRCQPANRYATKPVHPDADDAYLFESFLGSVDIVLIFCDVAC